MPFKPVGVEKPPKTSPSRWDVDPTRRPTPLITPNCVQIQAAVFPQFTHQTDKPTGRQTDRWDRRQTRSTPAYARLYYSDAANSKQWLEKDEISNSHDPSADNVSVAVQRVISGISNHMSSTPMVSFDSWLARHDFLLVFFRSRWNSSGGDITVLKMHIRV